MRRQQFVLVKMLASYSTQSSSCRQRLLRSLALRKTQEARRMAGLLDQGTTADAQSAGLHSAIWADKCIRIRWRASPWLPGSASLEQM